MSEAKRSRVRGAAPALSSRPSSSWDWNDHPDPASDGRSCPPHPILAWRLGSTSPTRGEVGAGAPRSAHGKRPYAAYAAFFSAKTSLCPSISSSTRWPVGSLSKSSPMLKVSPLT
ncbi:hypothetical protein SAMN05519103_07602 [Rhizobiales bacterium GAS113]|nr:hypothetical protein SAMN05519103_07602 [Rhizobiales bacterium GAS113]